MNYSRTIQIRLSREQYNRIKQDSRLFGFNSLSAYLRYLALGRNHLNEKRIREIHEKLLGEEKTNQIKIKKHYPFVNM